MRGRKEGPPGGIWASEGDAQRGEVIEGMDHCRCQKDTSSVMAKAGINLNTNPSPKTHVLGV